MKKRFNKYSHIWVLSYLLLYLPWYFGLQQKGNLELFDVYTRFDASLPFISWFIYPYVYWFGFVAVTCIYMFFKAERKAFYQFIGYLFLGMTICCVIFTVFPTSFNHRPLTFEAGPLTTFLLNFIYSSDKAMNVFPSIHVYNSIVCAIGWLKTEKGQHSKTIQGFAIISAVLITLSTMFIKQHSVLDAISAMGLALVLYPIFYRKKITD